MGVLWRAMQRAHGAGLGGPSPHGEQPGGLARWPWGRMARCEVCGRWPAEPVCADCLRELADAGQGIPDRCPQCAMPSPAPRTCADCRLRPPPWDGCAAALPYAYPWDGLITRLKFGDEPGLAAPLAGLMACTPAIARALDGAEGVIAVPLSPARLAARGYNQALELARRLAPGERLLRGVLRRVRDTDPQSTLDREDRAANLRHAFAVDPARAATIRGRRLLLVDDVMTSGATLHEAARVLRAAGAARVSAVVLARTGLP